MNQKSMASQFTDPHFLRTDQYRDSTNLDARVVIHQRFSTNPYGWLNWVFDSLADAPANAAVLEVGCGPAYLWKECARRIPPGWDITLTDLSQGMVEAARENLKGAGREFKFRQNDVQSLPDPDGRFDMVIANHMLYHAADRPGALAGIRRVLKAGGRLMASTVGDGHLKELNEWMGRLTPEGGYTPFANSFTLENGLEQLAPFFSRIILRRYADNLQVTEIEPLFAYVRSMVHTADISEASLSQLRGELEGELNDKGMLFITKDSGLFEAIK